MSRQFLVNRTKVLLRIYLTIGLCLLMEGCGSQEPTYLESLRGSSPSNNLPAALKTNGPFRRPVLRIAIDDTRAVVVTENQFPGQKYSIWSSNDLQNWTWRAFTRAVPTALLPRDRLYWFVEGSLFSSDYGNQSQLVSFPYDGEISELVSDRRSFLAVSGTAGVYDRSENGHWSTVATTAATEQLSTVTRTTQGICAVARNTRTVWFWTDAQSKPTDSILPPSLGDPKQVVSNTLHTYLLTSAALLEGDLSCGSWREIAVPPDTGERYSVAAGGSNLYLATAGGLYRYNGAAWNQFPTKITRALVRRLKAIDGTLYACHSGGLEESSDFGQTWKPSGNPIGIGPRVEDVISYNGFLYAATDRGLYKKDDASGGWSLVTLPLTAPVHLRDVVSNEQAYLLIAGEPTEGSSPIWVLDPHTSRWTSVTSGLENVHGFNAFKEIAGAVYAPTDVGIFRLDTGGQKWIPDPNNNLFGSVTAVGTFGRQGMILVTATHDLWSTEHASAPNHQWHRFLDDALIKNYQGPVNDIWSNPKDHDDTYLALFAQLPFSRDNRVMFANPPEFGEGFFFASIRRGRDYFLFLATDSGVDYVDRKYAPTSWVISLASSYHDKSQQWWFWPINLLIAAVGLYAAAAVSILALLYLRIPRGLIGSEWLTTQIAKLVTISPLLGRWILFIGYSDRVQQKLTGRVKLEDGKMYEIPSESDKASDLWAQISIILSANRFCLIEHGVFPLFPEYLTLRCLKGDEKGAILSPTIPILISATSWKGSVSKSASQVLKNTYGVPLDEEDMLKGQMERGDLLFIFSNIEDLGERVPDFLSEIRDTITIANVQKCYFVACCKSAADIELGKSAILLHLLAKGTDPSNRR